MPRIDPRAGRFRTVLRVSAALMAAALIYQHASREADRAIADHLGVHVEAITNRTDDEGEQTG